MPLLKDIHSIAFSNAGYYIIRDESVYLAISCGPNHPNGNFTHAHNDKLSFELNYNGFDFIVDPGSFTYTMNPDLRNLFRSTMYHNTIRIDHQEQNSFVKDDIFTLNDNTNTQSVSFNIDDTSSQSFMGEHYGYQKLTDPVIHQRKILYSKNKKVIEVEDHLLGKDVHFVEIIFNIHNDVNISLINNKTLSLTNNDSTIEITFELQNYKIKIDNSFYSTGLGLNVKNKRIIFEQNIKFPLNSKIKFKLK